MERLLEAVEKGLAGPPPKEEKPAKSKTAEGEKS
jgi:hypothetical protein